MNRSVLRAASTLAVIFAAVTPAQAQYTFVTTRAGIGGNGLLDWASLGPNSTPVTNGTSGIAITNTTTVATVSQVGSNPLERRDQGPGWAGSFAPNSALLWTGGSNGPMTIWFSSAVAAAGAGFDTNYFGPFTGTIDALDASSNVLATFGFSGTQTGAGDGSNAFAGVASTLGNISGIRFTGVTASFDPNDFAIDNVSVNLNAQVVPEPSTYALMATGLIGLGLTARRRRRA